jgi:nitrogen regulatory protein PII
VSLHSLRLMKLIQCIVRPSKAEDVCAAVKSVGVSGMTVTDVREHGEQKNHTAIYRGAEYHVDALPKVMVEVVASDDLTDDVLAAVLRTARTGTVGDGRIFVVPVEAAYRIRTGDLELH